MEPKFILLVLRIERGGEELVEEHDRAGSPAELMKRARFVGDRPLRLGPRDVAYIFAPELKDRPLRVGLPVDPDRGGFPRWV